MSISGSTVSTTYTYDLNGNQTAGLGRTVTWTSYNKPATITQGARSASFLHDMDHQRFKQVATDGTTLYLNAFGVMAELIAPGTSAARWNDYLAVGNVKVGVRFTEVVATTVTTRYFHTDHLGSIAAITNEAGTVVERLSYDAWGKRRFPNGADDPAGSIESETTRGFTGHEQLDVVGLVHMNGRVYDPMIGRMISPDPIVPDALNAQAWNRYSYVGNDPLTFTDPTGHSWLGNFFKTIIRAVVTIVAAIVLAPIAAIVAAAVGITAATVGAGIASAVTAGLGAGMASAIVTGLSGGNLGQMLRAGAIAGATAFAFNIAGGMTNAVAGGDLNAEHVTPKFGSDAHIFQIASHSAVGCVSAAASGGRCQDGALSAGIGAAAGPLVGDIFPNARTDVGQRIGGSMLTGAIGGLASVAGGGKFENGAVTAAFGYLFNALGDLPPAPRGHNAATWRYSPLMDEFGEIVHRLIDPEGRYWTAHPEDKGHWRHWDVRDPNDPDGGGGSQSRWPENAIKPWETQKRAPYGNQSGTDPSGSAAPWTPPTDVGRMITPSPFAPGSPIVRFRMPMPLVPAIP